VRKATATPQLRVTSALFFMTPPAALYERCRDVEALPKLFAHVQSVLRSSDIGSLWTVKLGAEPISCDMVLAEDLPGRSLIWRSPPGAALAAVVALRFEPRDEGTIVTVDLDYERSRGRAITAVVRRQLEHDLHADLRRYRSVSEAGEAATTKGQPVGAQPLHALVGSHR
jgi:uncharacterized membrane protein